jgi:8-oxo-dGTP pyrophosphatase MutT (NUDIX family)
VRPDPFPAASAAPSRLADPAPRPGGFVDGLVQRALRLAYRGLRLWWFVRRPSHQGAVVAVWHGGRLLLLRHSYRDVLGFPGGGVGRRETPEAAARRELVEELGLRLGDAPLALAAETTLFWEYRRDHVRIFEVELASPPALAIDNREVVAARFVTPGEALALPLSPFVRLYLERAAGQAR